MPPVDELALQNLQNELNGQQQEEAKRESIGMRNIEEAVREEEISEETQMQRIPANEDMAYPRG